MIKYFNSEDKNCIKDISNYLIEKLKNVKNKNIKILNIGTDECMGDSFAPFVGLILKQSNLTEVEIIGDLFNPVDGEVLTDIVNDHITEDDFIIAIDACLGEKNKVGYIMITENAISPGKCVDNVLPSIGNIGIAGIVNAKEKDAYLNLHTLAYYTPLSRVYKMAEIIAKSIYNSVKSIYKESPQ